MSSITYQTLSQYAGLIGEKEAKSYLESRGFEVCSFCAMIMDFHRVPGKIYEYLELKRRGYKTSTPYMKRLREEIFAKGLKLFENFDNLLNFERFYRAWTEDLDVPSGKALSIVERASNFGFDFVAKKHGKFYFIEVKTNTARLRKYQRKMLLRSKEFGFIPLVVRVRVDIRVPDDEIRIVEL